MSSAGYLFSLSSIGEKRTACCFSSISTGDGEDRIGFLFLGKVTNCAYLSPSLFTAEILGALLVRKSEIHVQSDFVNCSENWENILVHMRTNSRLEIRCAFVFHIKLYLWSVLGNIQYPPGKCLLFISIIYRSFLLHLSMCSLSTVGCLEKQ